MLATQAQIHVGGVAIGGGAAVSVQSMTSTFTHDTEATLAQVMRLHEAGCQIVRMAIPDKESICSFAKIVERSPLPVVADIHFDYRLALDAIFAGAAKIRINPGNIGAEERVAAVARACRDKNIPIRIGVNSGSIEKTALARHIGEAVPAMVESALIQMRQLLKYDCSALCVSLKASTVRETIFAYRQLRAESNVPLHLGITHAGTPKMGIIKSSIGIGSLLADGIGDTLRVSLTADPVEEVEAGLQILRAVGLRRDRPEVVACPTCGRCRVDIQALAEKVEACLSSCHLPITVAVMGCAVNGPGEARHADIGVAGGDGTGLLFRKGEILRKVPEADIVDALLSLVEEIQREDAI